MLNFKDWKLASSDGNVATLKHARGHEMKISVKSLPKIQREQIMRLAKIQEYKDGGAVQKFADNPDGVQADNSAADPQPVQQPAAPAPVQLTINNGPSAAPPATAAAPAPNPVQSAAAAPVKAEVPQGVSAPGPVNGVLHPGGQPNPNAILQSGQAGVAGQRAVDIGSSQAAIPVEQSQIKAEQESQANIQRRMNMMENETQALYGDINSGKIDPSRIMTVPRKITSGIGLILGGLGAGKLGSTDNPAMRMLNAQIDRDIDAQKTSFNNKSTILGAYEKLFGRGVEAETMARNAMLEVYKHQLNLIKDQLGTPQANATANMLSGNIATQQGENVKKGALRVSSVPGSQPSYQETGAMGAANVMHGTLPAGKQGPANAQATPAKAPAAAPKPIAEREWLDANDKPITGHAYKAVMAGLNPNASDEELQAQGFYPKENPRSKQLKEITTHKIPPLLKPNAEQQMNDLQYDQQKLPYAEDINRNFKNAKFIDQNMEKMNQLYAQAVDSVEKAGVTGRVRDAGSGVVGSITSAIGGLTGHGAAAAGAAGAGAAGALDTRELRLRNDALNNLESIINASLNGVKGVDADTVHRWVQGAKPVYGDTPGDIKTKFHNLIDLVKGHAARDHIGHLLR